ncbi:unnamed protein product [Diatraea saccharalis]|uniref:AB hydrolase-1 domain-containing protein n=1 Tax=Diatraea saccharalis TaxID=40085 RepID=A0A9N9RDB0_9NEOP|nr:unnamed protein product [Diatraea saccharalis]
MVNKGHLLILAIAIASCRGGLTDYLFPTLSNTVRGFTGIIANQPVVQYATRTTVNVIDLLVGGLTGGDVSTGRSLTPLGIVPNLFNDKNVLDSSDSIRTEYDAGLLNEDTKLDCPSLIHKYGYPVERHATVTEDGYELTLFRIPGNGSVMFLMHGLLGSADDYVLAGSYSGVAYLLSQEGYDVWLGNARGNKYSRRHREVSPSDPSFWDFSWHEIGYHDLPAMIDYVLQVTGQDSVKYIGHSQGTTSFFVMASTRPEYNRKISLMVALSPVAYMSHVKSPIVRLLAPSNRLLGGITNLIGLHEFLPDNTLVRALKQLMCGVGPASEILCSNLVFMVAGAGFEQLNVTNLPVMYSHFPSGAATKQFIHYAQSYVSGEFRYYDHGVSENVRRFGVPEPPYYRLGDITCPVSLIYSDADWLSHPTDVDKLYNELGNCIDIHKVPFSPFNHLDFILAKDFHTLIYERLRKLLSFF